MSGAFQIPLCGDNLPSVSDICRAPSVMVITASSPPSRSMVVWSPSSVGVIKINVYGSFSTAKLASGIGGAFKDHSGSILLHFTKHIQVDSAIYVEILTIREDILIATTSC